MIALVSKLLRKVKTPESPGKETKGMNDNRKETAATEQVTDELDRHRTTIGLKRTTKSRLDKNRAPGQCYDGFVCQLVDLWEEKLKR